MTLTSDYTWQLNSGVILNDDSLSLPFVDITKVSGLDSAPYRETIRDHEGQDGGFIDAEFEQGRELSLEGTAYCDVANVEPYFDTLKANYAPVTSPIPLVFKASGVAERVIFVKPRGVRYDWDIARRTGCTPIQFLMYAEDPRIYDNSLLSVVIPFGGLATTGYGFSYGFNLSFGASVPPVGGIVLVTGNRPAPALLTITGPTVDPRIINDTLGRTLGLSFTLGVSDVVVIDLANRTCILNGSANLRGFMTQTDWWLFNKGSTSIRFGGASGSGTLTVSYRNAWR